jgi:hypothetical protein
VMNTVERQQPQFAKCSFRGVERDFFGHEAGHTSSQVFRLHPIRSGNSSVVGFLVRSACGPDTHWSDCITRIEGKTDASERTRRLRDLLGTSEISAYPLCLVAVNGLLLAA